MRRAIENAIGMVSGGALAAFLVIALNANVGPEGPAGPAGPSGPPGPVGTSTENSGLIYAHNAKLVSEYSEQYMGTSASENAIPQIWLSSETNTGSSSPITSVTMLNTSPMNRFGELAFQTEQGGLTDTWALAVDPNHRNTEEFVIRNRGELAATFEEDLGFRVERGLRLGQFADIRAHVAGVDRLMMRALPQGTLQIGATEGYTETTIFGGGLTGVVVDPNGYVRTGGVVLVDEGGGLWLIQVTADGTLVTQPFE